MKVLAEAEFDRNVPSAEVNMCTVEGVQIIQSGVPLQRRLCRWHGNDFRLGVWP